MAGADENSSEQRESIKLDGSHAGIVFSNRLSEQYMDDLFGSKDAAAKPGKSLDRVASNEPDNTRLNSLFLEGMPAGKKAEAAKATVVPADAAVARTSASTDEIASKVVDVLDNLFGMKQVREFRKNDALDHTTAVFADGHTRTELLVDGKQVATQLAFPPQPGDPRGAVNVDISKNGVVTRYGNAVEVDGIQIVGMETQATGVAFKGVDGRSIALTPDQVRLNPWLQADLARAVSIARFEGLAQENNVPSSAELLGLSQDQTSAVLAFQNQFARPDGSKFSFEQAIVAMNPDSPLRTADQVNAALDLRQSLNRDKATALLEPFGFAANSAFLDALCARLEMPYIEPKSQAQAVADFQSDPLSQPVPDLLDMLSLNQGQRLTVGLLKEQGDPRSPAEISAAAGWRAPEFIQAAMAQQAQMNQAKLELQGQQVPPVVPADGFDTFHIGNRDFRAALASDGRTSRLSFSSPDGSSTIEMLRDSASGALIVSKATGDYLPKDGVINFEGLPIAVTADHRIIGDISFKSNGEVTYKTSDAPDRQVYVRKPDGTLVSYDFKTWQRTTLPPGGEAKTTYWDGWEWRDGRISADGSKIEFTLPFPDKPSYIQRDLSAGQDKTMI